MLSSSPPPPASNAPASLWARFACLRWAYVLIAFLPLAFVAIEVAKWVRNVPNWDEFDTVLAWLIAIDSGASGSTLISQLFAVQNEHRTAVSRLIVAAIYGVTGRIDFVALAVLGNLFLVGVFAFVLAAAKEPPARLRLAAVFALGVFQLQHHESFFWAGASIDHFLVILGVAGAMAGVLAGRRVALALGGGCAWIASFALAHGLLVWPLGAAVLAVERRWRDLLYWILMGAGAAAVFFAGFYVNPGHRLPRAAELPAILGFWLTLVGSSPALENMAVAPWLGALFVVLAGFIVVRGLRTGEKLASALALWCVGALAMIAWGRALLSHPWTPVTSRYLILSSIAWVLLVWILLERAAARFPRRREWLVLGLGGLAAFNLAANDRHRAAGRVFARKAELAVRTFHQDGSFARAPVPLYPDPELADPLIREAARRGIYRLPDAASLTLVDPGPMAIGEAREIGGAAYFIEECTVTATEVRVQGWAFRPEKAMRLGDLAIAFRSRQGLLVFEATPRMRPDVAETFKRCDAIYAGFDLAVPVGKLPPGLLGVGVVFSPQQDPTYMMTSSTIEITAR